MRSYVSRHRLLFYFVTVFVFEWVLSGLLAPLNPYLVAIIALVPAPVAFLVAAWAEGSAGARRLWRQSLDWRSYARWYLPAILVPLLVGLVAAGVALALGERPAPTVGLLAGLLPVTFILAAGEEIGWQGFAIPSLRASLASLPTALLFGAWHALFHLPMFLLPLPDELRQASPFYLFALLAIAFSVYRVWLFDRTRGSVPVAIIFHTAINTAAVLLNGVAPSLTGWLLPALWAGAALLLIAAGGLRSRQAPGVQPAR